MDVYDKKRKVYLQDRGTYNRIVMNYHEKRNIFTYEFGKEFVEVLDEVHKGTKKVCLLTGVKDCFCAGADLKTIITPGVNIKDYLSRVIKQLDKIEKSDKIFISAVNGLALGGGFETALATDIIIASDKAKFGLPEVLLGLIPGADGIKRLAKTVSKQTASWMLLTGKTIDAKEAMKMGLINQVVPHKRLEKESDKLAKEMASKNLEAVKNIKRLIRESIRKDITKKEMKAFEECLKTPHTQQKIRDFFNK